MKKMKLNLRKFGLLAIVSVGLLTISCEKEDVDIEDAESVEVEAITVSKPITIVYKYNYNGQIFTEKQWEVEAS